MTRARSWWVLVVLFSGACGDDGGGEPDASTGDTCTRDVECDDGLYCNGTERCMPSDPSATELGCISGDAPCAESCNEAEDRCLEGCPDNDGDGVADITCGGEDCDDADPNRYPGNPEVCDSEGIDEDCNPMTLGDDLDEDGFVDDRCCNTQRDGALLCGTDCDDTSRSINPEAVDTCGNGDEDCDGDIDEDPDLLFFRDADMDTYGLTGDSLRACTAPDGYAVRDGDCNDANDTVNPGATELCDAMMRDDDCDGTANEDCGCAPTGTSRTCGTTDIGECNFGTQTCLPSGDGGSVWGPCSGNTEPEAEGCNALDDDCDGSSDEGFECIRGTVQSGTNDCGRAASRTCQSTTCTWNPPTFGIPETGATCDYCDDSGLGLSQEVPNASATFTTTFDDTPITRYGAALGVFCSGTCIRLTGTDGNTNTAGGAYYTSAIQVGYGTVVYDVETEVRPKRNISATPIGDGWAMILVDASTGSEFVGPGGLALGVPTDRNGLAVEWRFSEPGGANRQTTDSLTLRHLRASASDPVVATTNGVTPQAFDSTSTTLRWFQRVRVTLSPDIPGDALNETEVSVETFDGSWMSAFSCGSGTACPFTIEAGSTIRVGVTGASRDGYEARMYVQTDSTLTVNGRCP